jgi:hypothetical protein
VKIVSMAGGSFSNGPYRGRAVSRILVVRCTGSGCHVQKYFTNIPFLILP